jgi:hypothetical protein
MITLRARINNGKLSNSTSAQIKEYINSLEGKEIEITLKRARSKRSDRQNRYYFGCVVVIVRNALKDLGHELTSEECHEWLKIKFNSVSLANDTGEFIGSIGGSTTAMSKTEFGEYIERIARWCAEMLSVVIPEPNEQLEISTNH